MKIQLTLLACAAVTASATWTPGASFAASKSAKTLAQALFHQHRRLDDHDNDDKPEPAKAKCVKGQMSDGVGMFVPTAGVCNQQTSNAGASDFFKCDEGTNKLFYQSTNTTNCDVDTDTAKVDTSMTCGAVVDGVELTLYDSGCDKSMENSMFLLSSDNCIGGSFTAKCTTDGVEFKRFEAGSECKGDSIDVNFKPGTCSMMGGKFSNFCTAPKSQCENDHDYFPGFEGGCHSCENAPDDCADLLPMIKKGGCYAECAVGWSESTITKMSAEGKCSAGEIEKALGRKTSAELKKEMDAVGCGQLERYCGPAENGGMTKNYIPEFKGGCSSCDEAPDDCEEAIDFLTTGCHAGCSIGMTPEAIAELLTQLECTDAEKQKAQDAVALEQKSLLGAGDSMLVNGLSLAALAAAAVFSAVC